MDPRFDDLLHTIIVEKGQGVYGFLDVVMGFMYRRTDFFYEMAPNENMGFFPGQAEAIIYNYFKKYRDIHYKERVPKRDIDPKEIQEFMKLHKEGKVSKIDSNSTKEIKDIPKEKEDSKKEDIKTSYTLNDNLKQNIEKEKLESQSGNIDLSIDRSHLIKNNLGDKEKETKKSLESIKDNKENNSNSQTNKTTEKFVSISTYNGDSCDSYNWSQGTTEVQIQIKLPENTGAKKIRVDWTSTTIKVYIKQTDELYFEAEFCEKIKLDESYWTCEDSNSLILYLCKLTEVIWKSAFKGHKEIDTKTVDNSKRIEEFDNDTQAALNKIVYEQNRKKNGLPTSEEEKKLKALEEAWNKPDSPFRGQPFDPKSFNLNEPIYYNTPDYEAKLKWEESRKNENNKK